MNQNSTQETLMEKKSSVPRLRYWIAITSALLVSSITTVIGYWGYMNYKGYCWTENSQLTNEEKIRRAVGDVMSQYPPAVVPVEWCEVNCGDRKLRIIPIDEIPQKKGWMQYPPDQPIRYKSIEEFFSQNPACCDLRSNQQWNPVSPEYGVPSFFDKVTGREVSYVRIRYLVKYLEDGQEKQLQATYYAGLSTCAKPRWRNVIPRYADAGKR